MAEECEEETLVEEVEVWVEKDFPASLLPSWLFNSSYRLLWSFLWIPISSGTFLGGEGWLKTSNSSMDSVRSTSLLPLVSFFLPSLLEEWVKEMVLLLKG